MLTSSEKSQDTVYMKKLDNGVAIKEINTTTGEEVVFLVTVDSNLHSGKNKAPTSERRYKSLTSSNENVNDGSLSQNSIFKPDITDLNPSNEEKSTKNTQKTNTIFVKNTKLVKEQGLHISIPEKVKYINITDNNKNKTLFKTSSSFTKPYQIIAGDYVFYLNIDSLQSSEEKKKCTDTRPKRALSRLLEDTSTVCNIGSDSASKNQVRHEYLNQATQTEENEATQNETNGSLTDKPHKRHLNNSCATQTKSIKTFNFGTSTSELQMVQEGNLKTFSFGALDTELDHDSQTEVMFEKNRSTHIIGQQNSESSLKTFESHTQFGNTNIDVDQFLDHDQRQCAFPHTQSLSDNTLPESSVGGSKNIDVEEVNNAIKIFDNNSHFSHTPSSSHDSQTFTEESNILVDNSVSKSVNITKNTTPEVDGVDFCKRKEEDKNSDSSMMIHENKNRGNVTIKEIKQRLNKATFSLTQLYSAVELMENLSLTSYSTDNIEDVTIASVNTFENDTQSVAAVNSLEDGRTAGYHLCDRCGSFYVTCHSCDCYDYYSNSLPNVQNNVIKGIVVFQKNASHSQNNKHAKIKNTRGKKPLGIQNKCYPVERLSKTTQDDESHDIRDLYAHTSTTSTINKNKYNCIPRDSTKSKTSIKISETNSCNNRSIKNLCEKNNGVEVNRRNDTFSSFTVGGLANQSNSTLYQCDSEEIMSTISLPKGNTKALETNSLCDYLNSSAFNTPKSSMSTNFEPLPIKNVLNVSPNQKRKLACLHGGRQEKSSIGFTTGQGLSYTQSGLKFNRKLAHSAPNTQAFSNNTQQSKLEKNTLLTTEQRSSSGIITVLKNKSQCLSTKSTSFSTLHIIPSSDEVFQEAENLKCKLNFVQKSLQNIANFKTKLKTKSEPLNKISNKFSNSSVNSTQNSKNINFYSTENCKNKDFRSSIDLIGILKDEKQVCLKDCESTLHCTKKKVVSENHEKIKCPKKKRWLFCFTL